MFPVGHFPDGHFAASYFPPGAPEEEVVVPVEPSIPDVGGGYAFPRYGRRRERIPPVKPPINDAQDLRDLMDIIQILKLMHKL